ncbi:MAG: hypothetical protein D6781_09295 [Verrucomicrobia bacterium]|nr:MAG: hypothetical protein D6781_09295 [Verrucomicrobiota bacterium]
MHSLNTFRSGTDEASRAFRRTRRLSLSMLAAATLAALPAQAVQVAVTFTNDGPDNGIWFVSPWVGFHDGTVDLADAGQPASPAIEAIAEDGNTAPLDAAFAEAAPGGTSATLGGPTAPGWSQTFVFDLDPTNPQHRYMSYALMLIPSNDAFVVNDDPMAVPVFDETGNFIARSFTIGGDRVYDAGTEINDEIPANTAFLGQAAPNTGTPENGVITMHPGFMAAGSGGILDASTNFGGTTSSFSGGDFTQPGYTLARVTISLVNNAYTGAPLVNISTRGVAGNDSRVQIAGFVVGRGDATSYLIRGIGPGLEGMGVAAPLADPTIAVFDADGAMIASNDDWETQDTPENRAALDEATVATGAFTLTEGSADAALVVTLPPGTYTAQVLPKDGAEGVALVEVYEVP